jgi:predicted CopG family antitoxin
MVKVISLSNEAYEKLKAIKGERSFSEVVIDVIVNKKKGKKKNLMDFFGIWKDDKELEKIFKQIHEDRKKFALREVKF